MPLRFKRLAVPALSGSGKANGKDGLFVIRVKIEELRNDSVVECCKWAGCEAERGCNKQNILGHVSGLKQRKLKSKISIFNRRTAPHARKDNKDWRFSNKGEWHSVPT